MRTLIKKQILSVLEEWKVHAELMYGSEKETLKEKEKILERIKAAEEAIIHEDDYDNNIYIDVKAKTKEVENLINEELIKNCNMTKIADYTYIGNGSKVFVETFFATKRLSKYIDQIEFMYRTVSGEEEDLLKYLREKENH